MTRKIDNYHAEMSEEILGVALKTETSKIVLIQKLPKPFRHHHIYRVYKNEVCDDRVTFSEGFYTNEREFITRTQAMELRKKTHGATEFSELYSEDLWSSQFIDVDTNNPKQIDALAACNSLNPFVKVTKK